MNPSDQATQAGQEVLETREWLDSLDYVLETWRSRTRRTAAAASGTAHRAIRLSPSVFRHHSLPEYDSGREAASVSRQPGAGAPHQEPGPLERAGDGDAGQQAAGGHRRAYLDLCFGGDAVRGCLQPFLPGADAGRRPRPGVLPGTRVAGNLFARISGRANLGEAAGEFPPRTGRGRRAELLSASLADARFLGVSHGLDGTGADPGDLPGALQPLSGESRT